MKNLYTAIATEYAKKADTAARDIASNETSLRYWSTPAKWDAYTNGKIDRATANTAAQKRAERECIKRADANIKKVKDAEDFVGRGYAIRLYGEPHYLNDIQIAATDDAGNVINHRKAPSAEKVENYLGGFVRRYNDHFVIYGDHFATLCFVVLTAAGGLGYIRAYFNRAMARFIIDDRNGDIYTSGECRHHEKTNERELARRLGIRSEKAKKEFHRIIEALINA